MIKYFNYNPVNKEDILTGEIFCIIDEDNVTKDNYILSNKGRIFNTRTKRDLTPQVRDDGILYIQLRKPDGKRKNVIMHSLVAKYYVPKSSKDILYTRNNIKFLDGNKENIESSNLKWVNLSELRSNKSNVKINTNTVHKICSLLEAGYCVREIENILKRDNKNISYNMIYNIATKRTWKEISDNYNLSEIVKKQGFRIKLS